jgi:[acyl-carrier-protein] S-malonyltransferase
MLFPGQASQFVGMTGDLMQRRGPGADFLAKVNETLGYNLSDIMLEGPEDTLTETWNAQPAILAHSVAIAMELRELGILPSIVAGHSLGEYSAAVAVSALKPEDGLRLVRRRGDLMFNAGRETPGSMAAIMGLPAEEVGKVCDQITSEHGVVVVANHNSAQQIAISGEVDAVDAACVTLKEKGAKRAIRLNVSGAFHSPLLQASADVFKLDLANVSLSDPVAPLVANTSARPVTTAAELSDGFMLQLTSPVLWHDIMQEIAKHVGSPRVVLEVGPGRVLSNMAKREFKDVTFIPVGTVADLDNVLDKIQECL